MPTPEIKSQHTAGTTIGDSFDVTPDDDTDLPGAPCSALYLGTPGTLVVQWETGRIQTFHDYGLQWFPGRVMRVLATNPDTADETAAQNIVAVY